MKKHTPPLDKITVKNFMQLLAQLKKTFDGYSYLEISAALTCFFCETGLLNPEQEIGIGNLLNKLAKDYKIKETLFPDLQKVKKSPPN